jgi:hypothetical protein
MPLEEGSSALGLAPGDLPAGRAERNRAVLERIGETAQAEVESAADEALASRATRMPDGSDVAADVYAEWAD